MERRAGREWARLTLTVTAAAVYWGLVAVAVLLIGVMVLTLLRCGPELMGC